MSEKERVPGDGDIAKSPDQTPENTPKEPTEKIISRIIEDEMKQSYMDYAMSVIVSRALPDVRDGLKPVHRRVLFAMHELGLAHSKPYKKAARIVGEVLGKYHPHGDSAVYQTLVRMVQDFSLRYPLADGQGNFGSVDGDNAAAMRYTEARLSKIAEEMLEDIEKETVEFVPNFDASLEEPSLLPSKFPNLLVNGSSGIAVGMATNMPPHNMTEVIDGICATIDNPQISAMQVMEFIKGPDFPTAALIVGDQGIKEAYLTGRGKVQIRARTHTETVGKKQAIIVDEIPYQVNKSMLLEEMAGLIRDGVIEGISDIRDESDREGIRVVFELKKDASQEVVLNQLFKHTRLETVFGITNLALVEGQPVTLPLLELIRQFIKHRQIVVRKRVGFELKKAEEKAHLLEGLQIALENIDKAIELIKAAKATAEAREALMDAFNLSEKQASAILEMKLQKLTALEQTKLRDELISLKEFIKKCIEILADENKILQIIKEELISIKEHYGDKRKTEIIAGEGEDIIVEDLIEHETVVVTKSNKGYIKRQPMSVYRQQHRGGKGIIAATASDDDFVEDIFIADTHSYILFFSDKGKVHWLKVYEIPEASRQAKGKPIINLLDLEPNEIITAMIPVARFEKDHYLFMATRRGVVKKTDLTDFSRPRRGGIIAINLDEEDTLIGVHMTNGQKDIILATRDGTAIRFTESAVRPMGRASHGVRGVTLRSDDEVISLVIAHEHETILTVTENGYGKRTPLEEYRRTGRAGIGVINIICSDRNGKVVSTKAVGENAQIMIISQKGIAIRTPVKDISIIGRNTQGVRLMKLDEGDKVVSAEKIITEGDETTIEHQQKPSNEDIEDLQSNKSSDNNDSPKEVVVPRNE